VEEEPENTGYMNYLGSIYCDALGRYEEAQALFEKVVELNPDANAVRGNMAVAARKSGDFEGSSMIYQELLMEYPDYEGMINRISFIVEDNCNINGIDCRGNLYVGRLGPNFKIILFKFMGQEIYPQCFLGTFNMKNRCLDGVWSSNVNVSDILEKINTWGRNSDRLAYLVNENLDGVNILIERAYKNVFNSPWSSGRDRDLISQLKGIQYYQRKYK